MNTIWSDYVQGTKTLYLSRKLRFDDIFFGQYKTLFDIDTERNLNILEIGCGPGALATSLHRWYPNAEITAIDRDSNFITYAKSSAPEIKFLEGDAEKLPFCDCTFDITISNTVSEHIETSKFFGEQMRVLKPGGICLVLSSRRGITSKTECLEMSDTEKKFWQKAESEYDTTYDKYSICKYPMSESALPLEMEKYGFKNIRSGYALIDLTPDDPKYSANMAHDMINADRYTSIEAIDAAVRYNKNINADEAEKVKRIINEKYDKRTALYDNGKKQWDTSVSIIMVVRGVK